MRALYIILLMIIAHAATGQAVWVKYNSVDSANVISSIIDYNMFTDSTVFEQRGEERIYYPNLITKQVMERYYSDSLGQSIRVIPTPYSYPIGDWIPLTRPVYEIDLRDTTENWRMY
jgi:ribosomal 30S subunit maturation factor RimM